MRELSSEAQGYFYAIFAFLFWGIVPIYFKIVSSVAPLEVLSHRIIWSALMLLVMIVYARQYSAFKDLLRNKHTLFLLTLSAFLISINWIVFIWAVSNDKITESSLGYYINPLFSFLLGVVFFKDRPSFLQKSAIALAAIAIMYQIITLGSIPIVSILLALSFSFYGAIRKKANVPAMVGLYMETLILLPVALLYFGYLVIANQNSFVFPPNGLSLLLVLAGVVTVIPLLWFNAATTRISLVHIGFFQYIGPTVSFLIAIFIYNEPLEPQKLLTFVLIWIALLIFSVDGYLKRKKAIAKQ